MISSSALKTFNRRDYLKKNWYKNEHEIYSMLACDLKELDEAHDRLVQAFQTRDPRQVQDALRLQKEISLEYGVSLMETAVAQISKKIGTGDFQPAVLKEYEHQFHRFQKDLRILKNQMESL